MTAKGTTAYRPNRNRWAETREDERRREEYEHKPKNKWGFAFCFLFTNQAGTVIFSFSGFALMITTMLFHWYAPSLTSAGVRALQNVLLHTYFFVMLAGFIIAFIGAYVEKGVLAKVAALLILIGTVLYLIFFLFSFFTESMVMLYVCPEMRCPDHHWLQDSMWRGYVLYSENIERYRNLEKEIKQIEDKIKSAIKEELVLSESNNSHQPMFLQNLFSNSYLVKKKTNQSDVSTITRLAIEQPKKMRGQYIRFISPDNEGSTILIVISVLFGIMILAYFVYAIITFYAYGMYLAHEK